VIVVTLGCCYAACWEATKRYGIREVVAQRILDIDDDGVAAWHRWYLPETARVNMPFIVTIDPNGSPPEVHCWCFGYVAKLGPS
jgi:hypothetical protein